MSVDTRVVETPKTKRIKKEKRSICLRLMGYFIFIKTSSIVKLNSIITHICKKDIELNSLFEEVFFTSLYPVGFRSAKE